MRLIGRIYSFDTDLNEDMVGQWPIATWSCPACELDWRRYVTPGKSTRHAHDGEGRTCPQCGGRLHAQCDYHSVHRRRTFWLLRKLGRPDRRWLEAHHPMTDF